MIVNGRRAFVGSDARTEKVRIKEALDQPAPLQINLAVSAGPKDNEILVRYTVSNRPNETMTNIALVGKESAKTSVSGGENADRTLQQHHVVRSFKSTLLDGEKEQAMLTIPESGIRYCLRAASKDHGHTWCRGD